MTHQDLLDIGFRVHGESEDDPYYMIVFKPPFKFDIRTLSGSLEDGVFLLYANDTKYISMEELKKIIDLLSSGIRN